MIGRILVGAMAFAAFAGGGASALTVRVMKGSAAGMASTFVRAPDAPRSTFERASPQSTFQSVFEPSEVAPERVETTRSLLSQLEARRSDGDIVVDLPTDVLFAFDSAAIRAEAEPPLSKAAELLRSYPRAQVTITGHTDAKGDDAYNQGLSLKRARAVADRLSSAASRPLEAKGFGEAQPAAPNQKPDGQDDPEGRAKNRRVEIRIAPAGG